MEKEAFNKKKSLFTSELDLNLRKELVKLVLAADPDIMVRDIDLVTLCRLGSGGVDIYVERMVKAKF